MTSPYRSRSAILGAALAALVVAGLASPAAAALPPGAQRAAELRAVIDAALPVFDIVPIDAVTYGEPDLYAVTSGDCTLEVRIVDIPTRQAPGFVGPRMFTAIAGEPVCAGDGAP